MGKTRSRSKKPERVAPGDHKVPPRKVAAKKLGHVVGKASPQKSIQRKVGKYSVPSQGKGVREGYAVWDHKTAVRKIIDGLPAEALAEIQGSLDLTNEELAYTITLSPRTLARRKESERLPVDESERVWRILRLIEIATEVFGSEDEARMWMKEPNYALDEVTPLEMARTGPGTEIVEQLLGSIVHGIPV